MKRFNTTGLCVPKKHYMVDISERLREIKAMVDAGDYFCINRPRQYGKTTTLVALDGYLQDEYAVVDLDFQVIGHESFLEEGVFCKTFSRVLLTSADENGMSIPASSVSLFEKLSERKTADGRMDELIYAFSDWCKQSPKPLILMIDEVDSATNYQVFWDFLAQLRSLYLKREKGKKIHTFHSVILAGVTDVRHLRAKIRSDEDHKVNSPWNIAAAFKIDMSLSELGIKGMLDEYEADHHTGMDTAAMAKSIHDYTSGYPFLVSRLCQLIDEDVSRTMSPTEAWSRIGMNEAVKGILFGYNLLFLSLVRILNYYPETKAAIRSLLMEGTRLTYDSQQEAIFWMKMYGLIRNDHNTVAIANRIFEMMLYNLFLSEEELECGVFSGESYQDRKIFVVDGELNIRLILDHFIKTYTQVYGPLGEKFKEKDGRVHFLHYLWPIISGTGNYYIEAQTRDQKRTDVVVEYLGRQYVIELKIWHEERYNAQGERQISEYLDYFGLSTGYMLSFNFNKTKDVGVKRVNIGDKVLFEATV